MKFLTGIKEVFGIAPKVADNLLDKDSGLLVKAGNFIDELNYSKQESVEDVKKLVQNFNDFVKATLTENTVRSKTRRSVAMLWVRAQLLLVALTAGVAPFDMDLAEFYWSIASSNILTFGTLGILAFFFGSHMVSGHLSQRKGG